MQVKQIGLAAIALFAIGGVVWALMPGTPAAVPKGATLEDGTPVPTTLGEAEAGMASSNVRLREVSATTYGTMLLREKKAAGSLKAETVKPLIQLAARDSSPRVRATAVTVLGRIEATPSVDLLFELMNDKDLVIRERAFASFTKVAGVEPACHPNDPEPKRQRMLGHIKEALPKIKSVLAAQPDWRK